MKNIPAFLITVLLLSLVISRVHGQENRTTFERSNGMETATYQEIIQYYQQLDSTYSQANLVQMGQTDSGFPLHLFMITKEGTTHPRLLRNNNRFVLLVNNGIHPGEPDGIEASMIFAREFLENYSDTPLMDSLIIGIIPVYNIGGALNRNSTSRVNQNGPLEYGFRGNARNYDLNRDFIKTDTKNARSFQQIFQLLDPDLLIDTHVSNGADYQYAITHLVTQHNKLGGSLGNYIHTVFRPQLEKEMAANNTKITPYVNVFNRPPDEGFEQFFDSPRYSTGYAALNNTVGCMIETHMLKPFATRVEATRIFLLSSLKLIREYGPIIQILREENQKLVTPGQPYPIQWKINRSVSRTIEFDGYQVSMEPSEISGLERLKYDESRPVTLQIPYFDTYIPEKSVNVPVAYVIPKGWHTIIEKLQDNGIRTIELENDTVLQVESYQIASFSSPDMPYEGHYFHREVKTTRRLAQMTFTAGDYVVPVEQPMGRYIVEVLEPEATDSFFRWNFFDTILQQKEGFSSYVFEDLAAEILRENERLADLLQKVKERDSTIANSAYLQLKFIYDQSGYREKPYMLYPVFRVPVK